MSGLLLETYTVREANYVIFLFIKSLLLTLVKPLFLCTALRYNGTPLLRPSRNKARGLKKRVCAQSVVHVQENNNSNEGFLEQQSCGKPKALYNAQYTANTKQGKVCSNLSCYLPYSIPPSLSLSHMCMHTHTHTHTHGHSTRARSLFL